MRDFISTKFLTINEIIVEEGIHQTKERLYNRERVCIYLIYHKLIMNLGIFKNRESFWNQ
jgi:hypothetical protein